MAEGSLRTVESNGLSSSGRSDECEPLNVQLEESGPSGAPETLTVKTSEVDFDKRARVGDNGKTCGSVRADGVTEGSGGIFANLRAGTPRAAVGEHCGEIRGRAVLRTLEAGVVGPVWTFFTCIFATTFLEDGVGNDRVAGEHWASSTLSDFLDWGRTSKGLSSESLRVRSISHSTIGFLLVMDDW